MRSFQKLTVSLAVIVSFLFSATASLASPTGPSNTRAYTATVMLTTPTYAFPGSKHITGHLATQARFYGGGNTLLVLASTRVHKVEYLKLRVPQRPNTRFVWVKSNNLFVSADPYRVVVSTGAKTATIYNNGQVMASTLAVVGAAATPTPHGLFAISEDVPQPPGSDLGPYVAALTAHSNFLQTFGGGDGTVGIHGYELLGAALGTASSHGCIRVPHSFVQQIINLPVGTPVVVQN